MPDAIQIFISNEDGEIIGEMFSRTIDQYDYQLVDLINKTPPGEYELVIYHYDEVGK